jgi:antitoxin (DNA-binding transcriptional repressor) of toxin-antitoxin stability system
MSARTVTIEHASQHLAELLELAGSGEEIVILGENQPDIQLVPLRRTGGPREFGKYRGKIEVHEDFDEPLPTEFWLGESA